MSRNSFEKKEALYHIYNQNIIVSNLNWTGFKGFLNKQIQIQTAMEAKLIDRKTIKKRRQILTL